MKKPSILKNKTLVIGCGGLGATIASKCSTEGKNVMIIDENPKTFEALSDRFSGYTFVGDASDLELLEEAGITSSKDIIITTGDESLNIFLAHVARKVYNVPNIYVRLSDPESEILLKGMEVKAIYPLQLSFDKFNIMRGGK